MYVKSICVSQDNYFNKYVYNKGLKEQIIEKNKPITDRIHTLMKVHRDNKYSLSKKINYAESALSKIFAYKSTFGLEPLIKISQIYNVSMDYIIFGVENNKEKELRDQLANANQLAEEYKNSAEILRKSMQILLEDKVGKRDKASKT